jgi:hypothetical protein
MPDFREMARDPKHKRGFEKLLYLAAKRGDDDIVAERLGWGIDPNCASVRGTTPMIANIRSGSPNAPTIEALLKAGADPSRIDHAGLTALDYARRKLAKMQSRPRRPPRKSPNLDENNQLNLPPDEQAELDEVRAEIGSGPDAADYLRMWWKERLRAARRVFNDPQQVGRIVEILEAAGNQKSSGDAK